MSSNAPTSAEVRPFPNAKVQPAIEAPEAPLKPADVTPLAPAKKKRSMRSMLLPIIGLALLGAGAWYGYD
ncbi:MAG: HlyD family secretion protein, partial [Mesorhizobium sp.]